LDFETILIAQFFPLSNQHHPTISTCDPDRSAKGNERKKSAGILRDKIILVYHTNQTKKDKKEQNKRKPISN